MMNRIIKCYFGDSVPQKNIYLPTLMLTGTTSAQVQCGFSAGSLKGRGYIVRDTPVPGTKGLVSVAAVLGSPAHYILTTSRKFFDCCTQKLIGE